MNSDQSMNRLVGELARWGIILPVDRDERTNQLLRELAAEKEAQMEGAKAILKPLTFIIVIVVFALCFWRYDLGLIASVGAALLTVPVLGLGISLPVGYILGRRAAQRFKARLRNAAG